MGMLKLEQRQKIEDSRERGREIQETGEQKLEEAEISVQALEQIEAIDDDDQAAVEAARMESDGIAKALAESEIAEPGAEVGEALKATSLESTEYSETELADAEKAAEMTGDYGDTGGDLSGHLWESGEEFREISAQSDQSREEIQSRLDQIASRLEGVF